jgi:hypothetical protein
MKALENLVMNASTSMAYAELPNKPPALKMYEIGHYFGDSVYFFPDPVQPIKEQIDLLSTKCAALIATGFHVGFLVRVGIAVGDLRIKQITLPEGEKREIKIGSSMAKAHTLQDLQDWVGGAVLSEFPAALPEINRLKYEVPLKDSGYSFSSTLEALNWVYILSGIYSHDKGKVINMIKQRILEIGDSKSEGITTKLENTLAIVDRVFNDSQYNPFKL